MINEQAASPAEAETIKKGKSKTGQRGTPLPESEFLKLDEVAAIMNVARRTVDYLISSGELESYRFRSTRRVARRDLDEYLERARLDDRPTLSERHREVVRRPRRKRATASA